MNDFFSSFQLLDQKYDDENNKDLMVNMCLIISLILQRYIIQYDTYNAFKLALYCIHEYCTSLTQLDIFADTDTNIDLTPEL